MAFGDRRGGRHAIDGSGGREDQGAHARPDQGGGKGGRCADIVVIVLGRIAHAFADQGEGGEVHGGLDVVALDDVAHEIAVAQIALLQRPPLHRLGIAGRQVVQGHG